MVSLHKERGHVGHMLWKSHNLSKREERFHQRDGKKAQSVKQLGFTDDLDWTSFYAIEVELQLETCDVVCLVQA